MVFRRFVALCALCALVGAGLGVAVRGALLLAGLYGQTLPNAALEETPSEESGRKCVQETA